jgi:hypothetical protein
MGNCFSVLCKYYLKNILVSLMKLMNYIIFNTVTCPGIRDKKLVDYGLDEAGLLDDSFTVAGIYSSRRCHLTSSSVFWVLSSRADWLAWTSWADSLLYAMGSPLTLRSFPTLMYVSIAIPRVLMKFRLKFKQNFLAYGQTPLPLEWRVQIQLYWFSIACWKWLKLKLCFGSYTFHVGLYSWYLLYIRSSVSLTSCIIQYHS